MNLSDQERRERLREFFLNSPQEWEDLKWELQACLYNAEVALKAINCDKRDFYAGKCQGINEVFLLEEKFKNMPEPEDRK